MLDQCPRLRPDDRFRRQLNLFYSVWPAISSRASETGIVGLWYKHIVHIRGRHGQALRILVQLLSSHSPQSPDPIAENTYFRKILVAHVGPPLKKVYAGSGNTVK